VGFSIKHEEIQARKASLFVFSSSCDDVLVVLSGSLPRPVPLAFLPMAPPTAADLNLNGTERYQAGQWVEALEPFDAALPADPAFMKDHFNVALALHQMERQEQATVYF